MEAPVKKVSIYERVVEELDNPRVREDIVKGKRMGWYQLKGQLGSGNFSKVKLAVHLLTKERVAVKVIDRSQLDSQSRKVLSREIACMEKLVHPNIIRLFEVIETFTHHYLVMEYAPDGNVEERICSGGPFSERRGKQIFYQIAAAVDYMHQAGVIHRDLKAENVFFCVRDSIKVGDFGFSTLSAPGTLLETFCGSPPYAAPELLQGQTYVGTAVDAWALGVLLYFMLTGETPFTGESVFVIKEKVSSGKYHIPERLSESCVALIEGLLETDSNQRFSVRDVLNSDWLMIVPMEVATPPGDAPFLGEAHESVDADILDDMVKDYGVPPPADHRSIMGEPRNSIAGTYRILHHRKISRTQGESINLSRVAADETEDAVGSNGRRRRTGREKSRICTVL